MKPVEESKIIWSPYMKYRAELRGFDPSEINKILRFSEERYIDTATQRLVVVGRHINKLVVVPYEIDGNEVRPITIHSTTRQQTKFRLKTGRFVYA